jgi:Tol biopolymer transport system component
MDLSRDERRVLLERYEGGYGELWVLDLARGVPSRLTFGPSWNFAGYWSPDGTQIVHSKTDKSTLIVQRSASGNQERQLFDSGSPGPTSPTNWSPDGRYIVYSTYDPKTLADLWVLPLSGDAKPSPYLQTQFLEGQGRVSPDGRWLAYTSNESGNPEVYVGSFPEAGAKSRVSIKGGVLPQWRADGKELYYLAPDQTFMAVAMRGAPDQAGAPEPLFTTPIVDWGGRMNYAPSADGKRFLVNTRLEAAPHAIHVITGWTPGTR